MAKMKAPPLGVMPKQIWIEQRVRALRAAIRRYRRAKLSVLPWPQELKEHIASLRKDSRS